MKKIFLTIILCMVVSICFAGQNNPEKPYASLYDVNIWNEEQTFLSGITVGGVSSKVESADTGEYILFNPDDAILFQGVGGGSGDQNILFNLDSASYPTISSSSATYLKIAEGLRLEQTDPIILLVNNPGGAAAQIASNAVGGLTLKADEANAFANTSLGFKLDGSSVMSFFAGIGTISTPLVVSGSEIKVTDSGFVLECTFTPEASGTGCAGGSVIDAGATTDMCVVCN